MPIIKVQKAEVKLKRPLVDISLPEFRRGLIKSPMFEWLPVAMNKDEVLPLIAAETPVDGSEIVPWMQEAAAMNAVLDARAEEYAKAGSFFSSRVGDGLIPSVGIGSGAQGVRFTSGTASVVSGQRGAYVVSGGKSFFCPEYSKLTMVTQDLLAWAAIPGVYAIQWLAALMSWVREALASNPISDRIGFGTVGLLAAPNFFVVKSSVLPPPAMVMHVGVTSNKDQKIGLNMRGFSDFTKVLSSDSIEVKAGESTIDYFILGFPVVEKFVLELQPQNGTNTILDSLTTTPP